MTPLGTPHGATPASDEQLLQLAGIANDAARREAPQWIGLVTLMVYLAISVGTTTHRALLEQTPMRLPLLYIDVPLVTFFWLAPLLLVIIHFYVQAQLAAVTGKVARFFAAASARAAADATAGAGERARLLEALLEPLDGFAGAQHAPSAAASRRIALARMMTTVTITIAPSLLVGFFLLKFLPYQSEAVTWLHRALLLATLLSSLYFRAVQASVETDIVRFLAGLPKRLATRDRGLARRVLLVAGVAAFFSIATVRGEAIDWADHPLRLGWLLHDGQIAEASGRPPPSVFSRVLVLPDETLTGASAADIENERVARTAVLRGRALRGAVLTASDLRKADLTSADLRGARLDGAWLDQAYLAGARLDGATARGTVFRGAWMTGASLDAAVLDAADLRGASMDGALLRGASLREARLQAAALENADARGADFHAAHLQGAFLLHAGLEGARFTGADLRAADLRFSKPGRAEFAHANLRFAALPAPQDQKGTPPAAAPVRLAHVPPGQARRAAAARLAAPGPRATPPSRPIERVVAELADIAEPVDVAAYLNDIACLHEDFPFVLRGVLHQIWEDDPTTRRALGSPARDILARSLLDPRTCPVAADIPRDSRGRLATITAGRDRPDWRPAALTD